MQEEIKSTKATSFCFAEHSVETVALCPFENTLLYIIEGSAWSTEKIKKRLWSFFSMPNVTQATYPDVKLTSAKYLLQYLHQCTIFCAVFCAKLQNFFIESAYLYIIFKKSVKDTSKR